jgi:hypothetical protein
MGGWRRVKMRVLTQAQATHDAAGLGELGLPGLRVRASFYFLPLPPQSGSCPQDHFLHFGLLR